MSANVSGLARQYDGADREFPPSPVPPSPVLRPLDAWICVYEECRAMGVAFDAFWYEAVAEGVCYFYRWLGHPRASVLVVFDEKLVKHIECRRKDGAELSADESAPIVAHVAQAFAKAGYSVAPGQTFQ